MKFTLLAVILLAGEPIHVNETYPDQATCESAMTKILAREGNDALCVPQGEDSQTAMFDKFLNMVDKLQNDVNIKQ